MNNNINQNTQEHNNWPINHVVKTLKNEKAYDRARDRKNKKLYDYEPDIVDEEPLDDTK